MREKAVSLEASGSSTASQSNTDSEANPKSSTESKSDLSAKHLCLGLLLVCDIVANQLEAAGAGMPTEYLDCATGALGAKTDGPVVTGAEDISP